jgi:hypothetical protein
LAMGALAVQTKGARTVHHGPQSRKSRPGGKATKVMYPPGRGARGDGLA